MHDSYISSLISLRCKGSLSFSINDYTYCLNDRLDRNRISLSPPSSSCCAFCANCIYRVPQNPSFLYGLRQSTLIQWSPCRRLVLGGGNRCYSWLPVCDIIQNCHYEKSYTFKERSVGGRRRRRGKGKYGFTVEERREWHGSSDVDDAEVILSLLTEEVGEECLGVSQRNGRSSRRVQVEDRGNVGGICYRGKKRNDGLGVLESSSRCEYESSTIQSTEEDKRHKEERENFQSGENRRARKEGASCSSNYSLSSLGEFESDTEVEVKQEGFVGEPLSGYKRDPKRTREIRYDREDAEATKKQGDYAEEHGVVSKKEHRAKGLCAASSGAEGDWRKKSEKKLTEVSIGQVESREESSQEHLRLSEVHESGYGKASRLRKQYEDQEEKSTLAVNIDEGTKKKYSPIDHQVTGQSGSRMKYKQFTVIAENHVSDVQTTSSCQKKYSGMEENKTAAVSLVRERREEHRKSASNITKQDEYKRNSQQLAQVSEIQEIDIRGNSSLQRQSDTIMMSCKENSTMTSVDDKGEQHHQAGQWVTRQIDSRGKSQQLTGISDTPDVDIEGRFISQTQSDTRMKKQEEASNLAFRSYQEARKQCSQIDPKFSKSLEPKKGSQDVTNVSRVHHSHTGTVANTERVLEKRMSSQERYSASMMKSVEETIERDDLIDERVLRTGSRQGAQRSTKVLTVQEGMLEEASSSQASLKLQFQSRAQEIGVDEEDQRSSQTIPMPSSAQSIARVPLHVEPTSGFATQAVSSESIKGGSSSLVVPRQEISPALQHEVRGGAISCEGDGEPLSFISHEDALGSADRLQQSSMQFVGEFVEKVRHEVSTSEMQKEKKTREVMLVYDDKQHKQKGLSQYGSEDSRPKEHHSRRSSQGSRTRGPSDDVTEPSIQEPPETDVPKGTTTTGNAAVGRTGRSLWNIIGDVARMRWASRSRSHSSASKSGGRSSPNQSTSSEAWFSGQEPEENNDEDVKKERRKMPKESTSIDQQQTGRISTQSQGEGSSSISSEEKMKHVGVDSLSSSSVLESGSASEGISSHFSEETSKKDFEGTSSGTAIAESSFPLSGMRLRRSPVVKEISEAGKTDASGSGTMVQTEQPLSTGLTHMSKTEGKDGELKRPKLQRHNQVSKDMFDEWEEAYKLETEQQKIDEMFMREALLEAKNAADMWEVPVGAVLVRNGKIIARGCNLVEELRDSTAHAEMICIREASKVLQTWRLSDATLYVTLEPCAMCAGAIFQARVDTVVWGAPNKLLGADGSWIRLFPSGGEEASSLERTDKPAAPVHPFHPKIKIRRGVLASECADAMQQFFQLRRKKEKNPEPPTPPSCLPISTHPSRFFTKMHDAFNIMFCL